MGVFTLVLNGCAAGAHRTSIPVCAPARWANSGRDATVHRNPATGGL